MNFDQSETWQNKTWLNDFTSPKLAKDLTSIYADDVLQAVEDKEFNTLKAAIDDLSLRVGLSREESGAVYRVASIKKNPKVFVAKENISNFGLDKLGAVIAAYGRECDSCNAGPCACGKKLSSITKNAIEEIGINNLVDRFASLYAEAAGVDGAKLKKIMKDDGCSAAEAMKKYHSEGKSEDSSEDKEAEASAKGKVATADVEVTDKREDGSTYATEEELERHFPDKVKKMKEEAEKKASSTSKVVTADAETDAENEDADDSGAQELDVDGEEGLDVDASAACNITTAKAKAKKKPAKKKKGAKKSMKKKKSKKAEWADFFAKKGWFQGADEPSKEGKITSNDPETLGYPGEVEYENKPMAVPVGEDSRPWEQKHFEDAAQVTKKVMGPKGKELEEKKKLQRAKWKQFFSKKAKGNS